MQISLGVFSVSFEDGGLRVIRDGKTLYFNARPVYVSVKTYAAVNEFRDAAYDRICEQDGAVTGETLFVTRNGSEISVRDIYETQDGRTLKITRRAEVRKADRDDLGFQTKISFYQALSDELRDFEYFSPGQWYLDNRYAADFALGKNMDLQYYWRKETYSGLPMFAMRHKAGGETVALSRWAADATLPSLDRTATENYAYVDPRMTVGSDAASGHGLRRRVHRLYLSRGQRTAALPELGPGQYPTADQQYHLGSSDAGGFRPAVCRGGVFRTVRRFQRDAAGNLAGDLFPAEGPPL